MNKKQSTFFSSVLIIFLLIAILLTIRPYIPIKQNPQETTTKETTKEENSTTAKKKEETSSTKETTTGTKETYLAETTTLSAVIAEDETEEQTTKLPMIEPSATTTAPSDPNSQDPETASEKPVTNTIIYQQKTYLAAKQFYQKNYAVYEEMLALVNTLRKEAGVSALTLDDNLCLASSMRAYEIAYQKFSHIRPNGQDYTKVLNELDIPFTAVWENIAAGQADAVSVMKDWCSSPEHYQKMINPDFKKLGIGVVYDTSLPYQYYWTQMFIR